MNSSRTYCGIGSRQTPEPVMQQMHTIAMALAGAGFTLRSGGAGGADMAFEFGADFGTGSKEIFLPWPGFNRNQSDFVEPASEAFTIAEMFHPNWVSLSPGAKRLMARNTHQILGPEIGKSPVSEFVVCWTPGGRLQGGTAQAIRLAHYYNVPVFNLGSITSMDALEKDLAKIVDAQPKS